MEANLHDIGMVKNVIIEVEMIYSVKRLCLSLALLVLTLGLCALNNWEASPSRRYLNPQSTRVSPGYQSSRADSAHGFDVQKYEITLTIDDALHQINGNVLATVNATSTLSSIAYELRNLTVSSVLVNGISTTWTHTGEMLTIPVNASLGQQFTTQVFYSGIPQLTSDIYHIGMIFGTNTVFTISDPDAGRNWWPCYDHPWDKAIVDLHISMRSDWKVAANGIRTSIVDNGNGTSTTHWLGQNPMTTYLVCITAGPYVEINQSVPEQNNLPVQNFVLQNQYNNALLDLQRVPEMIAFFSTQFGAYPFEKYGNATVNMSTYGAMEHQTMTTLGNYIINGLGTYEPTIAHELAHQWYGDALSFLTFKDVWLSEGFATYSEFLWTHHRFGWQSAVDYLTSSFHQYYLNWEASQGAQTIYNPTFNNYFAPPSYEKSASVLHMLRLKMGNAAFFQLLQQWFVAYQNGNAITSEFQALAEQISGQDLTQFFNQWIYGSGIPSVQYSVWHSSTGTDRLKLVAKTTSPTTTDFQVEVPFQLTQNGVSDSLVVFATPEGYSNEFTYSLAAGGIAISPNYHHWTLLREISEQKPVLTECLPSHNSVLLSWNGFINGIDDSYHIYRRQNGITAWVRLNASPWHDNSYLDTNATNGVTYDYAISVMDAQGFESSLSEPLTATPQAFSFNNNLLVVDETRDGNGANINPDDAMVDAFYNAALTGLATWDNWDCATQGLPPLSTLGSYKLVLWHADDFSQNMLQDNLANLSGYILGGGKLVLSGWKTASVLTTAFLDRFAGGITLVYDNTPSLIFTEPVAPWNWDNLYVDPAKTLPNWNYYLPYIYTFEGVDNSLLTANMTTTSAGNGNSIAFRFDNNGTLVLFGFPLYFMQLDGIRTMLQSLLPALNPALPNADAQIPAPKAELSAYPNPFNPSTVISYILPKTGFADLALYNIKGQLVKTLLSEIAPAGSHTIRFNALDNDGKNIASGVYLMRLKHHDGTITKKITMLK